MDKQCGYTMSINNVDEQFYEIIKFLQKLVFLSGMITKIDNKNNWILNFRILNFFKPLTI